MTTDPRPLDNAATAAGDALASPQVGRLAWLRGPQPLQWRSPRLSSRNSAAFDVPLTINDHTAGLSAGQGLAA